jgi:molybdopterin-guanine dinucleotide biosynthesis protein B
MRQTVIAVVGRKKSGKTVTIEALTRELTNRGYIVATAKHIPEPNFTIDKEGKDTWRFARSGARIVVGVSAEEIATIEKVHTEDLSLRGILLRCNGGQIVFLEGFRDLVARVKSIYKIVVLKSANDVAEATGTFDPILAFTGPYMPEKSTVKAPYFDSIKDGRKIADLIETFAKREDVT